ncbi:hypothetical protein HJC23_012226 [Cyclotella cryptica]|uniref:Uncharacterized protein n=1 Tax=Cyclotella cryptica TaxID=29204 RepID=A0ABD3P4M5_9STRA|eukprot:CCRYP_017717-RA/>CCRYP_017717-RA protein AED:0.25 eAED:0.25 QI:1710/1/1/1/1/1/2/437/194
MKLSTALAFLAPPCLPTQAFAPSSSTLRPAPASPTQLAAHRQNRISNAAAAAAAASSLVAILGLVHPTAALAHDVPSPFATVSAASSSTILPSSSSTTTLDQFTLPSYDAAKGSTLIDLNAEVQDVNKKTMATAKAKREYVDQSAEKAEMDELRRIEEEEKKLFESMTKQSDADRKARIEAEKAESRANRWNTF